MRIGIKYLQKSWKHGRLNNFSHNLLSSISKLCSRQLQALLHHVAAELLLGQLWEVADQLLHDGAIHLLLAQLQDILQTVIAEAILQEEPQFGINKLTSGRWKLPS